MFKIKDEIYWVGVKNWELRNFHGAEFSTPYGSSYNAYLIRDKQTALIDTVWQPFKEDFVNNLDQEVGLNNIDYIIINHSEIDHSGGLASLMHRIPDVPIYCTAKAKEILLKLFQKEWNFKVVKTGDTLNLGKNELLFIEAPMLHWPDSMLTFVKGTNVLLSNDAFGQHYAASGFFNDEVDQCKLDREAMKYFVNILHPFRKLIIQKIDQIKALNLTIEMIAPSHGIIWRDDPLQILDKYYEWSQNYQEDTVVIIYDTMWDSTRKIAHAIGEGIAREKVNYKIINATKFDNSDILVEVFKSKGILVGSPTVNNGILSSIPGLLEEIKGMKITGKIGGAFGSYGWSGEGVKIINNLLSEAKFEVINDGLKFKYKPTEEEFKECIEFGENFAKHIKGF
ncbi:MAG: anaerobic nitric oxide reductase flavorubredoxin [Clostridia bacterium]|nr:anaerobic nitric oxide reductase flavorubredoxin [Clostridia bacterium]